MDRQDLVSGWRGLAVAAGQRIGRPVSASRVRYRVESSGLDIGRKIGNALVFDESDIETTVRLLGGAR